MTQILKNEVNKPTAQLEMEQSKQKDESINVHPMVPVPEALEIVLRQAAQIVSSTTDATNIIAIDASPQDLLGKRICKDIFAPEPGFPPFNASIMDGYALCSRDNILREKEWTHQVVGSIYAGPVEQSSTFNNAKDILPMSMYITTGAVVPEPFDCVVPIEEVIESPCKTYIRVLKCFKTEPLKWIRPVGCDIAPKSLIIPKGQVLTEAELGVMICCGIRQVPVKVLPKVGFDLIFICDVT